MAGLIAVIASLGASLNDRADKQISKIKGDLDQIGWSGGSGTADNAHNGQNGAKNPDNVYGPP